MIPVFDNKRMPIAVDSAVKRIVADTAIVLLTWNQCAQTKRCLNSILESGFPLSRVVLWDNGSIDGTDEVIARAFPEVVYYRHSVNKGVASGRNSAALLAARALAPEYLLFLDNDMVVTPGFVEALCKPFVDNPELAQSTAKIRLLQDPARLQSAGGQRVCFGLGYKSGIGYNQLDRGQYDQRRDCLPSGGATLVSNSVFSELGGFDPAFDPFGAEDLDFSLRVRDAGYRASYEPEAIVFHDYIRKSPTNSGGSSFIAKRVNDWFRLFNRHASPAEKIAFVCGGGLIGLLRVVFRQIRRRDLAPLAGIATGESKAKLTARQHEAPELD